MIGVELLDPVKFINLSYPFTAENSKVTKKSNPSKHISIFNYTSKCSPVYHDPVPVSRLTRSELSRFLGT